MALFELVHLLSGLLGLLGSVGVLGPWEDRQWEFIASIWAGAVIVTGTGVVLSLSSVGTGAQVNAGVLLAKVILTVVLLGLMVVTLRGGDVSRTGDRDRLIGIAGLWTVLFALGIVLVI